MGQETINKMIKSIIAFIIGIILGITVTGFSIYLFKHNQITTELIHDTISIKIDSIQERIDTVFNDRVKLKYVYEKNVETISNQSADSDWVYYNNYLRSRFPGDSLTIKAN